MKLVPRSSGISILLYQSAINRPTRGRKYSVQLYSDGVSVAQSRRVLKRRADCAHHHADNDCKQAPPR